VIYAERLDSGKLQLSEGCKVKILCVLLLLVALQPQLGAVTLGQMQAFDDPVSGWVIGVGPGGATPQDVPLASVGGQAGDDDPYLNIVATGGSGIQSRLSAQNFNIWTGDYIAAGVNQIRMDVRNFGPSALFLRLLFLEFSPAMEPLSAAFSIEPIFVPSGSDWQTIAFDVWPSALTPIPEPFLPLADPVSSLSNTGELRIFHNPAPFFAPGMNPVVAATLGVDNVTAAFIPEPATWTLLLGGLLLTGVARRLRPRR
jgi:hypothetical protein